MERKNNFDKAYKGLMSKDSQSKKIGGKNKYSRFPQGVDYTLGLKDFIQAIRRYTPKQRKALLIHYTNLQKAHKISRVSDNNYKLSKLQRLEVIEYFGRFHSIRDVLKMINEEWNIKYSGTSLTRFRKRFEKEILEKRQKYIKSFNNVRLAHKRSRIEELSMLYEEAKENNYLDTAVRILDQINKEIEKNELSIIHAGEVNINQVDRLEVEVGMDNIKALAFIRVLSTIPANQRIRIDELLMKKADTIGFLSNNQEKIDSMKIIQNREALGESIENAEYEVLPEEKQKEQEKKKSLEEFVQNKINKVSKKTKVKKKKIKGLKSELLSTLKSSKNKLDGITANLNKKEIEKNGDLF